MNRSLLLFFIFLISGVLFFLFGILNEEIEFGIVLIFPFLVGSGIYSFLGFISILIAIIFLIFGFKNSILSNNINYSNIDINKIHKKKSVKGGGIILIGPIPIVFGSNWKITVLIIVITLVLILSSLLILLKI